MLLNKILLVINIFFLQSYLLRFSIGPYHTNLQEVLIALNALVFIFALPFKKIITGIGRHWIILSFAGLTLLSIILIPLVPLENNLDFLRHIKFLFFTSLLTFIFLKTFDNEVQRMAALRVMGGGAILFGIFSVIYNLLGYNVAPDSRLLGPLDAAVYLAYYLTPFFLFFAIQFFENPREKSNPIYAVILGLLILATRSMGAIGGSLAVMIFYFIKRSNLKSGLSKLIVTFLTIGIVGLIFYTKFLPTIQTNYSSLDERGEIWLTSTEILKEPKNIIFGLGFGQFEAHYIKNVDNVLGHRPLDYYVIQPHNIFLLFIFNYGILGLLFIIFCIYKVIQNLATFKQDPNLKIIASFILLYFFLHGLIDTPFFKNDILVLFILFLELALVQNPPHLRTVQIHLTQDRKQARSKRYKGRKRA